MVNRRASLLLTAKEREKIVAEAPHSPGVYLIKDAYGKIIYVGKAADLRKRIRNYFPKVGGINASTLPDVKTRILVSRAARVEFIETPNESEAMILEAKLVKLHSPRYNIRLKDDKKYPYIRITLGDEFPTISIARRPEAGSGSAYFGPYANAGLARSTVQLIKRLFGIRSCTGRRFQKRACLNYHIGMCSAPCIWTITREEYLKNVNLACELLEEPGTESNKAFNILKTVMKNSALSEDFEKAAAIRDALDEIRERSKISGFKTDYVSASCSPTECAIGVVSLESSARSRNESFMMRLPQETGGIGVLNENRALAEFIKQRYISSSGLGGRTLIVREDVPETETLRAALMKGGVRLKIATTPKEKRFLELASQTARMLQAEIGNKGSLDLAHSDFRALGLPEKPAIIDGIDVSGFGGRQVVGSVVVFRNGEPEKNAYRRYSIRGKGTISGGGSIDVACLAEIARRRYSKIRTEDIPDLVLVDGGRAQLNAVSRELENASLPTGVNVVSLAKRLEEVFVPGMRKPVRLDPSSPQLKLLQRVRDEAHRFAVSYHRRLERKEALK